MYLRPTTMRGIPLVSLTSSPLMRGFYVTRSDDDPPSSTLAVDFTSPYTTIDNSVEQQTVTALTPDISTTDETVTVIHNNESERNDNINDTVTDKVVAHNDQNELELDAFNDSVNDIKNNNREEKSSTFESSLISSEHSDSTENPSTYTKSYTITIPISKHVSSKKEKSLRNFDYINTTPLSNGYAVSPTTSTRRRISLALSKYKEASYPLWTGRRIVARKRNRTAFSSIKEAEKRIDDVAFPRSTTTSIFKSAPTTSEIPLTLTSAEHKFAAISTVPTIPLIVSESTISPKMLNVDSDFEYSTDGSKTENLKDRTNAEAAITLPNSVITTPPISKIASIANDSTATVIPTISDDFTSVTPMPSTTNESIIMTTPSSTIAVAKTPIIASDQATITTKSTTKSVEIEIPVSSTTNYSAAAVPTAMNTHAIANDSVIIPVTTSIGVEITSPIANYSTDFTNMIIPATVSAEDKITNYSAITAIPIINTSTDAIATDPAVTTAPTITIGTGIESTLSVAIPTTNTQEIAIEPTITTTSATSIVKSTIANHPAFVIPATTIIPATSTSPSTIISSTHVTTSNLAATDPVTVTNMLTTTTPTIVIPTITDSNIITSTNSNVPSTFAITDTSTTTSLPKTSSAISSKDFVTSTDVTSSNSTVPATLMIESTTIHLNPNVLNIGSNSEVSAAITTTAKAIRNTEIPTTFETSPIFTSTSISRALPSTNSTSSTTAFSDQTSDNSVTSTVTQTPSTLFSLVTPITNIATVKKSTLSATYDESIATNAIIQTTGIYEPSSVQMTSEKSSTPKIRIASEETPSRTIQSRKQDQTSKLDDQLGQKTSRRRVLNRTNNWLGRPVVTQQTVNQQPRHRVTLNRERPRRPIGYTSKVIEENRRRRIMQRRARVNFESISSTIKPNENVVVVQNTTEDQVTHDRTRNVKRRLKIVSNRVRENFPSNFSTNLQANENFSDKESTGSRIRVLLKSVRSKSNNKEINSTIAETSTDVIDENLENNLSSNLNTNENLSDEKKTSRRIVLKRIRPKFKEEKAKTEETSTESDSTDESLQGAFSNNLRSGKNFPIKSKTGRKIRVVLKRIKPKSEEKNSIAKETDSDSTDEDLQGSFSSNFYANVNRFDEEEISKSIKFKSEQKDSIAEETSAHSDFKDFSSNLHVDDNREKMITHFKYGRKEATIERLEDTEELQTTETVVLAEEDTDQPSLEVNSLKNSGSLSRKSAYSNRHRKPTTQSTTAAPLINSFPSTVAIYRSGRPIETTFSSRIDLVESFEDTRSTSNHNDQKADVSDQSIRAQEFAVTLADPPSSPDTGRTALRNAAIRKISTTVAPRTDPTIDRTISRYEADLRNRQRSKTKSTRPTLNATTRPRRPPVLDYDYYEDEVPIVIGKSFNSKLFLTSKGTIRCLDQGNFPHPYSCKKFITCARMVNGQVIGTEYTCPDRLTFDPVGGICNWSVGLGCKD